MHIRTLRAIFLGANHLYSKDAFTRTTVQCEDATFLGSNLFNAKMHLCEHIIRCEDANLDKIILSRHANLRERRQPPWALQIHTFVVCTPKLYKLLAYNGGCGYSQRPCRSSTARAVGIHIVVCICIYTLHALSLHIACFGLRLWLPSCDIQSLFLLVARSHLEKAINGLVTLASYLLS